MTEERQRQSDTERHDDRIDCVRRETETDTQREKDTHREMDKR